MMFKFFKAVLLTFTAFATHIVQAAPDYGFALGIATEHRVVAGSTVNVQAILKNTGSTPISFSNDIDDGLFDIDKGSFPFLSVSSGGDWNIFSDGFAFGSDLDFQSFLAQFKNVTINPEDSFAFTIFSFLVPTTEVAGSTAISAVTFGLNFNRNFTGDLAWLDATGNQIIYENYPTLSFTINDLASSSDLQFYEALVLNADHYQYSNVTEPSSLFLLLPMLMVLLQVRKKNNI